MNPYSSADSADERFSTPRARARGGGYLSSGDEGFMTPRRFPPNSARRFIPLMSRKVQDQEDIEPPEAFRPKNVMICGTMGFTRHGAKADLLLILWQPLPKQKARRASILPLRLRIENSRFHSSSFKPACLWFEFAAKSVATAP